MRRRGAEHCNLLRVYVTQSFSQLQMTQKQNLEAELRNQLLRLLLFGGKSQKEMITKLCGMLNLQLEFPLRIILLYERAAERNMKHLLDYPQFYPESDLENVLDRRRDVFGIQMRICDPAWRRRITGNAEEPG